MTRAVMLQGTGSDVGKSLIAAGLCRLYANRGLRVVPFKPQNMSNNAAATADGGEIGRAQALQALAARAEPTVDMNPILLKPEADGGAQIILQGRRVATLSARDYFAARRRYEPAILDSYRRLAASADLIIVEGAGSPAEINLREGDLANMGFAQAADLPVVLIGDVHRGGVIASLVGTFAVLGEADRQRIRAVLINNFHGDPTLFADALTLIETRTGCPSLGVIPHFPGARDLPAEDSMALERSRPVRDGPFNVAVLRLPRIANFDDLDPLRMEPSVAVTFVEAGSPIPPASALVILPGSKTTIADLQHLRAEGWDIDIKAHVRRGGHVLGLCGGYQMLGTRIHDPHGLEGPVQSVDGLGLLDVETTLEPGKSVKQTRAVHCVTGAPMAGYEIHLGHTRGQDCQRPFARIDNTSDGATSRDGRVAGTYLHGCFTGDDFRRAYLASLGVSLSGALAYAERIDATLDALAAHLERHMDVNRLLAIAAPVDQG